MKTNTHTHTFIHTLKEHRTEAEKKELFKSQIGFRLFPFFPCLLLLPPTTTITTKEKRNKNYFQKIGLSIKQKNKRKVPASMEEMNENIAD